MSGPYGTPVGSDAETPRRHAAQSPLQVGNSVARSLFDDRSRRRATVPAENGQRPRESYCVRVEVWVTIDGVDTLPLKHAWTSPVVLDVFESYTGRLAEVVTLTPGRAYLFFRRRSGTDVCPRDEAETRAQLCERLHTWVGKDAGCRTVVCTVEDARDNIARAWDLIRAERREGYRDRASSAQSSSPNPVSARRTRPPVMEDQSSDSDASGLLVGEDPPSTPRVNPRDPVRTGQDRSGSGRGRGRPSRTSRVNPPDSPASATGSRRPRGSSPGRAGPRVGKIDLPLFKDASEDAEINYESWRFDVLMYRDSHTEKAVLNAAYRSLAGKPGRLARSFGKVTLDELIAKLDEHYVKTPDFQEILGDLYKLRQSHKESAADFAVRVQEKVSALRDKDSVAFEALNAHEDLLADRFFDGLRSEHRRALRYLRRPAQGQPKTGYADLLLQAKKLEDDAEYQRGDDPPRYPQRSQTSGSAPTYGKPPGKRFNTRVTRPVSPPNDQDPPEEEEDFPEVPEPDDCDDQTHDWVELDALERDYKGFNARRVKGMNLVEAADRACYYCGSPDHFRRNCPHYKDFLEKSKGFGSGGPKKGTPVAPKGQSPPKQ